MKVRHIGFTGTRTGTTVRQHKVLRESFGQLFVPGSVLHFGDCVGADEEAAYLAREIGYSLHSHPQTDSSLRAFVLADVIEESLPPLSRNRVIVSSSLVLVGCPAEMVEQRRSGTWATIRYAREARQPVLLVLPDGSTHVDFNLRGAVPAW